MYNESRSVYGRAVRKVKTEKNIKNGLGERIYTLRKRAGLLQNELGDRLGVTGKAVSKWENGSAAPSTEALCRIAAVFGIEVDALIKEAHEKPAPFIRRQRTKGGMDSLRSLYRVGNGPSSSHTMGPESAARQFRMRHPDADRFEAVLYGSLAKTGKGHRTDYIVRQAFAPYPTTVSFDTLTTDIPHPNTMLLLAYKDNAEIGRARVFSIGGGEIAWEGETLEGHNPVYPHDSFDAIKAYCKEKRIRLWQYVEEVEGQRIWAYLADCWATMQEAIREGIDTTGVLFGGLNVQRKANHLYNQRHIDESTETRENRLVCAYAFAVSEQNAAAGRIVTAPTCGSCGVMPAVLQYVQERKGFSDRQILHAMAAGGIIGNLIKTNASISGAECGCQAEIGSACAMAAAALAELYEMNLDQIEYAAEISIEHHLGLTCDPIRGLVQIPCIERNAVAAMRAINAVNLANFLTDSRKISFDLVVKTMYETGKDLSRTYKETSEGGLAKLYV